MQLTCSRIPPLSLRRSSLRRLLLVEPATSSSVSMLEKLAVLGHFQIEKANRLESIPAIVDASQTRVAGTNLVKVLTWFDNEWAYANRMLDVVNYWQSI